MGSELTHFSLFSGIGGLDLAAEWAGFTTVGQCEFADYPTKVLEKHWPDVPRWRDIRSVTGESFRERTGLHTVDVISGGFPCQPFSVAGKQKGKDDERYLWPEMLRVIRELKPRWVVGENVPGIMRIAADDVCKGLEHEGYEVIVFNYEAAAVGAPHRRERVFFVGYAKHNGLPSPTITGSAGETSAYFTQRPDKTGEFTGAGQSRNGKVVADTLRIGSAAGIADSARRKERQTAEPFNGREALAGAKSEQCYGQMQSRRGRNGLADGGTYVPNTDNGSGSLRRNRKLSTAPKVENGWRDNRGRTKEYVSGQWWSAEPDVGRVANGVPSRVDRLRGIGNAVVPQQAYPIFKAIAEIEVNNA